MPQWPAEMVGKRSCMVKEEGSRKRWEERLKVERRVCGHVLAR